METVKKTRVVHSAEFKAGVVLAGLARSTSIAELCRQKGISASLFYEWKKRFIRYGKLGLKRPKSKKRRKSKTATGSPAESQTITELAISFQKFRSDQAQFAGRMAVPEKLKAVEMVESASVPKLRALRGIGVAKSSYYRWCRLLRENGSLGDYVRASEYCKVRDREDFKEQVFKVLHSPPSEYGFNRTTWRLVDLQAAIEQSGFRIGRHAIKHIIKDAGYRWKKARKVLTSKDPDYRPKLARIQEILGGLGDREGFFSIDEYGPFAIKQREGKKLVAPGTLYTVPQFQKSKGVLIMTAALELSTNQVTHFYSKKKNTDEMIKLLDVLLANYQHLDRFYMSWDAASWHVSKRLCERIQEVNSERSQSDGPIVELAPLPAGAQFLNVIEAIFSGMSRAVIHNSNYSSTEEATAAIDQYFQDRNEYFRANPRKAGKKIWGQERSITTFSESNNCKDSRYR
ncbi:IS630 family transposase [Ruegeria sp. HKCCA5426]|uniref:IS630 family transposase n=1 Tax=Ruegeria sp. HKCCA5426 TaxID=2682985 RepID=UPI001487FAC3|nr:IS630 family transposase [Ruegeria sp. HKCCA5426]